MDKLKEIYYKCTEDMELKFSYIQQIIDSYRKPNVFLVLTTYNMLSMLDFSIIQALRDYSIRFRAYDDNTKKLTEIIKFITDRIGDSNG